MSNKKNIAGVFVLCIATIICIAFGFYAKDTVSTNQEIKSVQISVINNDDIKTFEISTSGTTLLDAANEINLVAGENGPYGLFVKTVNGYTVNEDKQEWWCITKSSEAVLEGIENIKINDGDKYEITLKTGY